MRQVWPLALMLCADRVPNKTTHLLVEEGERAALNFQRKDFEIVQQDQVRDPSPTNRAVSIRCRMFSVMSELGQKRRFDCQPITSGLPCSTDILRARRHVSKVPISDWVVRIF